MFQTSIDGNQFKNRIIEDYLVKITHKISETTTGMLDGTAFLVSIRVDISSDEKVILDKFGANSAFEKLD